MILTGDLEAAPLATALQNTAVPGVSVAAITYLDELRDAHADGLAETRLISFCTRVVVPPEILGSLTLEPYNVHPGSPAYPGLYPEAFAAYDGAERFAATVHVMADDIDTGDIVKTDWFDVEPGWHRAQLAERVYQAALGLFFEAALECMASDAPLPRAADRWSGARRTRTEYREMCTPTGNKFEDERRRRAFEPDFPAESLG